MKTLALLLVPAIAVAGPLDSPSGGLQPSGQVVKTFPLHGVVSQKLQDGLLVRVTGSTGKAGLKDMVFLSGSFPQLFAGNKVDMMVSDAGTYSYEAVGGSGEIIRKVVPKR